jgi:hypothetical protein
MPQLAAGFDAPLNYAASELTLLELTVRVTNRSGASGHLFRSNSHKDGYVLVVRGDHPGELLVMRIGQNTPDIAIDATCDRRIVWLLKISTMEAGNGNRQFQRTR